MKKCRFMVPLVLMLCLSCAESPSPVVEAPPAVRVPDAVIEDDGLVTRFFDSTNPYAIAEIGEALTNPVVRTALSQFNARGYELREEYSFVTEGAGEGEEIELRILAMANVENDNKDAVNLVCFETDEDTVVLPLVVLRGNGNAPGSYDEPIGKVNFEALDPVTGGFSISAPGPVSWTWKSWGQCVAAGIASGGTGCLLHCRFLPVAYLKCLGACTAGHAVASLVSCTIREFSENKNK